MLENLEKIVQKYNIFLFEEMSQQYWENMFFCIVIYCDILIILFFLFNPEDKFISGKDVYIKK